MRTFSFACLAALLCLFARPIARAEENRETPASRLLSAHADSIVSVRFVLKIQISMMGQSQDEEMNRDVRGLVVDDKGLVLTASSHFEGGIAGQLAGMFGEQLDLEATPSDIRVVFGHEEEERAARLVARDSDLGLAFLQVQDLEGVTLHPLALGEGANPQVGDILYAVTRMGRGFDGAPRVGMVFVEAWVEQPRPLWAVTGTLDEAGMPVFDQAGALVGLLTMQEGSEGVSEGGGGGQFGALLSAGGQAENMGLFVLPVAAVRPKIEQARRQADETSSNSGGSGG